MKYKYYWALIFMSVLLSSCSTTHIVARNCDEIGRDRDGVYFDCEEVR